MGTWLGKWAAVILVCTQFASCALRPGSESATARTSAMGNSAASPAAAASPEGAAVAAELGYHGPVRRTDSKATD